MKMPHSDPPPKKKLERQRGPVHYDEAKKSQTDTKVTPSFVIKKIIS